MKKYGQFFLSFLLALVVTVMPTALNERGYDCGTPDGIMGNITKSALMKFQEDNGLVVDGIIGDQVTTALEIGST